MRAHVMQFLVVSTVMCVGFLGWGLGQEETSAVDIPTLGRKVGVADEGTITYRWDLYVPQGLDRNTCREVEALTLSNDDYADEEGQKLVNDLAARHGWTCKYPTGLGFVDFETTGRYRAILSWTPVGPRPHLLSERPLPEIPATEVSPEKVISALSSLGLEKCVELGTGYVFALGDGDIPVTLSAVAKYKRMETDADPIKNVQEGSSLQPMQNARIHLLAWEQNGSTVPEIFVTAEAPGRVKKVAKKGWERIGALLATGVDVRLFVGFNYDLGEGFGIAAGYGEFVSTTGGGEDTRGGVGIAVYGSLANILGLFD